MKCPHLADTTCSIVYERTGVEYVPEPAACADCAKQPMPQTWNKVTSGISLGVLHTSKSPLYSQKLHEWEEDIRAFLQQSQPAPPGMVEKTSHYAKAIAKWIAAGRPTRTDEQVAAILAICQPPPPAPKCDHYTGTSCKRCGCRINLSKRAAFNKARMATESCPLNKWE